MSPSILDTLTSGRICQWSAQYTYNRARLVLTLCCDSGSGFSRLAIHPRLHRSPSGKRVTVCINTGVEFDVITRKAEWWPRMFLYDWSLSRLAGIWCGCNSNRLLFLSRAWTMLGERRWKLDESQPLQVRIQIDHRWWRRLNRWDSWNNVSNSRCHTIRVSRRVSLLRSQSSTLTSQSALDSLTGRTLSIALSLLHLLCGKRSRYCLRANSSQNMQVASTCPPSFGNIILRAYV